MERWIGSEEECQRLEVRNAVEKCANLIFKELLEAVREQLGIEI